MFARTFALAGLALLAAPLAAQTTHVVNLNAQSFSPANITIQAGDTVMWNWNVGFHDVLSGTGGIQDGIFASGAPTFGPNTFSVTFDQAFLSANPVAGNSYDYYCSIHVGVGMTGNVTVDCAADLLPYGGTTNPAGSLQSTGSPTLGGTFTLLIDNPVGSQPAGSLAFLAVSNAPDPNFPGGTLLPGFGMLGATGELLIDIAPPNPIQVLNAGVWLGAPTPISITVPNDPGLACRSFFSQGLIFNGSGAGPRFGLTRAIEVVIGS